MARPHPERILHNARTTTLLFDTHTHLVRGEHQVDERRLPTLDEINALAANIPGNGVQPI
ncbi:hypothetical protein FVQ98_08840 [Ottowia sp. GY511]|uniref:Uncharacterized protein n=1 Tax=Ottowia flava TaxID=2675430 RepID=A0ABW4KM11_9BURK|nr:hypothetical protein [Ottowia sp. GY511]TXK29615.1 hypothetical protein FVQ98_08840 [Ottowia sp. GY511]